MFNRKLLTLGMASLLGAALLQSPVLQAEELPPAIKTKSLTTEARRALVDGNKPAPKLIEAETRLMLPEPAPAPAPGCCRAVSAPVRDRSG